jgi:hypothetical protein
LISIDSAIGTTAQMKYTAGFAAASQASQAARLRSRDRWIDPWQWHAIAAAYVVARARRVAGGAALGYTFASSRTQIFTVRSATCPERAA